MRLYTCRSYLQKRIGIGYHGYIWAILGVLRPRSGGKTTGGEGRGNEQTRKKTLAERNEAID